MNWRFIHISISIYPYSPFMWQIPEDLICPIGTCLGKPFLEPDPFRSGYSHSFCIYFFLRGMKEINNGNCFHLGFSLGLCHAIPFGYTAKEIRLWETLSVFTSCCTQWKQQYFPLCIRSLCLGAVRRTSNFQKYVIMKVYFKVRNLRNKEFLFYSLHALPPVFFFGFVFVLHWMYWGVYFLAL